MILVCSRRLRGCGYVGRQWDFENPDAGFHDAVPLKPNQQLLDFEKWAREGGSGVYPHDIEHESDFLTPCPECGLVGAVIQVTPENLYQVDAEFWGKASRLLGLELGSVPTPTLPDPVCLWICSVHEGGCGYVGNVGEWRHVSTDEGLIACPACGNLTAHNILNNRWLFCLTTAESWKQVSAMVGEVEGICAVPSLNQQFGGSITELLFGKESV